MAAQNNYSDIIKNARLEIIQHNFDDNGSVDQPNRILDCYSVSFMRSGSSRLHIYGRDYYAAEGDVLIIPPYVLHDHIMFRPGPARFMWWNFTYKLYNMIDVLNMRNHPIMFHVTDVETFETAFQSYLSCLNRLNKLSDYIFLEAKALELVAILLDMIPSPEMKNPEYPDVFVSILAEIMHHPEQRELLPMLAGKYHMHPTYISNQFKKLYRVTPARFQRQVRLQKAQDMLKGDRGSTVSEISAALGYEHPSDFTRFFKAQCGVSPQGYRNSAGGGGTLKCNPRPRSRDSPLENPHFALTRG